MAEKCPTLCGKSVVAEIYPKNTMQYDTNGCCHCLIRREVTPGISWLKTPPAAFPSLPQSSPSSVRVVSVPLTDHLEQLDAVVITGKAVTRSSVDTKSCENLHKLKRPPESEEEASDWQRLTPNIDVTLVYSAHYDARWRPVPLIQIIGVSSRHHLSGLVCRMWFADSEEPVFSRAVVQDVSETHGRRFDVSNGCSVI